MAERGTTARLGAEKFVALTTFKRNGDGVSTPMWVARDDDRLLVWTPADSWKVKRVRRDPRVTLAPCTRMGKVPAGSTPTAGKATVESDPAEVARARGLIKRKYGLGFRVVTLAERLLQRGRAQERVALIISIDDDDVTNTGRPMR